MGVGEEGIGELQIVGRRRIQRKIAAEKSGCIFYCTSQEAAAIISPSTRISKATASTVIATGNLRQGRLMADHGGLYSATKPRLIGAKGGYCMSVAVIQGKPLGSEVPWEWN